MQLASLVFYVSLNDRLYGGFTPLAVAGRAGHRARRGSAATSTALPRLATLWVERDAGLLRWAPVLALAFLGAWLLWRSRRERLGELVAERRDAEHAAFLALAVCAAQVAVAAFAAAAARRDAGAPRSRRRCRAPCRSSRGACGTRRALGVALGALTLLGERLARRGRGGVGRAGVRRAVGAARGGVPARGPRLRAGRCGARPARRSAALEWRRRRELRV